MPPTTASANSLTAAAFSPAALKEAQLAAPITVGATGDAVRRVQEWLTLSRLGVVIDGVFGPATETAIRGVQQEKSLTVNGIVDDVTYGVLTSPIATALAPIAPSDSFGSDTVRAAEQHVAQHPREIGGQNKGPWVRLYMNGEEGTDFPWCAGFACTMIKQAANGRPLPFKASVSCDELGKSAKQLGLFRDGTSIKPEEIRPGSLFLVRRANGQGWHHTGIVSSAAGESVTTLEGNTNDDGSREGYEAIKRVRRLAGVDYIIVPN
ncbi:MAG TPA: peptidoglycan-binding domain-containing protein [Gemmatimonadaceae bacterium]|nr:peptidoglycan-binding domain-containing protein [Gemmatimonadaceae bacterium]